MSKQDKSKIQCPECGSLIKAWADLDAQVSFVVSRTGKLTKRLIRNVYQSDGRCGVECTECDWELHNEDMDVNNPYLEYSKLAFASQEQIEGLSPKPPALE